MSFADFFTIKTPQQRRAEEKQYRQWAFPYGEQQHLALVNLLKQLLPEEKDTAMAVYLIGREAYQGSFLADYGDRTMDERLEDTIDRLRSQLPGKHRSKLWRYLALILADADVDETLNYPSAEELRQTAQALQERQGR